MFSEPEKFGIMRSYLTGSGNGFIQPGGLEEGVGVGERREEVLERLDCYMAFQKVHYMTTTQEK